MTGQSIDEEDISEGIDDTDLPGEGGEPENNEGGLFGGGLFGPGGFNPGSSGGGGSNPLY